MCENIKIMLLSNPSSVNRIRRTPIKNTCFFAYNSEKGKRFKTEMTVLKALKKKKRARASSALWVFGEW